MRAWPGDSTVAHLIFLDHLHVPDDDELREALRHAERKGARAVRTSAMFPDVAEVVLAAGFSTIDRLALLQLDLEPSTDDDGSEPAIDLGPMRPWHRHRCAEVDRMSFGLRWGNTPSSLREISVATPHHRGQVARLGRRIEGFAISGAAGAQGYLQRLAVAPSARRRGIARALVADSLEWMRRRQLRSALVNTGIDNEGALALYDSVGFRRLGDELTIAERVLAEPARG
jgi:ribosomal protein S18 acetylase RimI-like enzyme